LDGKKNGRRNGTEDLTFIHAALTSLTLSSLYSYSIVRGEILGFLEDELLRKHLPRMFSLIKNES